MAGGLQDLGYEHFLSSILDDCPTRHVLKSPSLPETFEESREKLLVESAIIQDLKLSPIRDLKGI